MLAYQRCSNLIQLCNLNINVPQCFGDDSVQAHWESDLHEAAIVNEARFLIRASPRNSRMNLHILSQRRMIGA